MKLYKTCYFISIAFLILVLTACNKEENPRLEVLTKTPSTAAISTDINSGGIITGDEGASITEKGVCWSETENPTIEDNKESVETTSNEYTVTITGLEKSKTYFIKAYLISDSKTIYGNQKTMEVTGEVGFLPDPEDGKEWTIQPKFTNEFNYDQGKASPEFTDNWKDMFINPWTGPGKTVFTPSHSSIVDGQLVYKATVVGQTVQTGCISSIETVGYPLYMEARVKASESVLASGVWLLSPDSEQEIDNLETYGDKTNDYFSERLHLSHHTFIRQPFQDYQPTGPETWYTDGNGTKWADAFHNYGVLWEDPWSLSYYVDGKLVRTTPEDEIDPLDFTEGTGLNKNMHLLISAEAQPWREETNPAQVADFLTDPSVLDSDRSTMRVDWIRVYKPE